MTMLVGCGGSKDKAPSQSLAQVNGSDITVLQMNEELARSKVPASQKDAATKQLLEGLIDRQLLQNEALRDKVDRDPQVVQAIERARSQILTQAYLQKRLVNVAKPGMSEIEAYFNAHPEIFAQSKIYTLRELIIATAEVNAELAALFAKTSSLEELATWMRVHNIQYTNNQLTRGAGDLPSELLKKLQDMRKGQLFTATEGDRSIVAELIDIRDNPVTLNAAAAQIGQFLTNEKNKAAAEAEVARLRANAKIVYLNQADKPELADKSAAAPARAVAAAKVSTANESAANESAANESSTIVAAEKATAPVSSSTAVTVYAASATAPSIASAPASTAVTDDQIKRGVAGLR